MVDELNEAARKTGKTQVELLDEARNVLLGEPTGIRRWVEKVQNALRRPTEQDRINRRLFEENRAQGQLAAFEHAKKEALAVADDDKAHGAQGLKRG